MKCPKCGSATKVYEKRWWNVDEKQGKNLRRRICVGCGFKFKSLESYFEPIKCYGGDTNVRHQTGTE